MMKKTTRVACGMTICALLASIMMQQPYAMTPACPEGTEAFTEYRLFFGRNQGDVEAVSESDWQDFLAVEVTPEFPDGLTVMDAAGQWRNAAGAIVRERSKLVLILAPPGKDALRRTNEIAEAYKRAFGQESVLRAVTQTCASF